MKGYIYKYTFPDGKVYIGQTRRPIEMRHREHLNPSTGPFNPGFWDAYQKVGMPALSILETLESDDLSDLVRRLNALETRYIYRENATDPAFGYNRKEIATTYIPDIAILRREYASLCKKAENDKRPFFNKLTQKLFDGKDTDFTEEEKAFIDAYIEHNNIFVHSDEDMVYMEDEDDVDEGGDFMLEEAIDYAIWLYNEETFEIIARYISENASEILRREKQSKIIQQLDLDGNVIREYETQDDLRDALAIVRLDNIINVIKGRQKTAYGFRWRYKPVEG